MKNLLTKDFKSLNVDESLFLYENLSTSELIFIANSIRQKIHKENYVGWIIDRNINITNVCVANCKFCNFHKKINSKNSYITKIEEYKKKILILFKNGGNQLLLQGGLHPKLKLDFYENLFRNLKNLYPKLKLHALGPPEIVHISKLENKSYKEVLQRLVKSGLDSLPGAGAEILNDEVRKNLSKYKCNSAEWLNVMSEAHKLNILTSSTMMFGHIESKKERIEHLHLIRDLQEKKPENSVGFISFTPWTFQDFGTVLKKNNVKYQLVSAEEYIRTVAISRIILHNIKNIQASWLTVGVETAQVCLHSGANDFGSIMMEENVVSSAGASNKLDKKGMKKAILEAGFIPKIRNQNYDFIKNKLFYKK